MSIFDSPIFDPRHELRFNTLIAGLAIACAVTTIIRMTKPVSPASTPHTTLDRY